MIYMIGRKWAEVLKLLPSLFEAVAEDSDAIGRATDSAIQAAGAGHGEEVLDILQSSKGRPALEPLEIGLRKFLGQAPVAPKEIADVGNDIAEQIKVIADAYSIGQQR